MYLTHTFLSLGKFISPQNFQILFIKQVILFPVGNLQSSKYCKTLPFSFKRQKRWKTLVNVNETIKKHEQ